MADQPTTTERAQLALMVIGPDRRERLITRRADRIAIAHGITVDAARRYATDQVNDAIPHAILSVGQTWTQRDGQSLPSAELSRAAQERSYAVAGFTDDGMVSVNDGNLHLGVHLFERMLLTAWPEEYTLIEEPQPPQATLPPPEEESTSDEDDEERFDPHQLWVMVHRAREDGLPIGEGIPLLSAHYQAQNWKKPEYEPSYANMLDVPAYLNEHLDDYRAGWPDFHAQYKHSTENWLGYFNHLGACDCDVIIAVYLGRWLWQRVRADVITEYGGTVDGYDVMFPWAPYYADAVLEVAPYAHPEWEIPPDHRLAQCDGQADLFGEER